MLPRLNLWRIYADVFSNLMGLVLLGGIGLMALFGGALIANLPSASAFPARCPSAAGAWKILRAAGLTPDRPNDKCELAVPVTRISFAENETTLPGDVGAVCKALVAVLDVTSADDGRVQIIGHASAVNRGGACREGLGLHSPAEYRAYSEDPRRSEMEKDMARTLGPRGAAPGRIQEMQDIACNLQISAKRAEAVARTCMAGAYRGDYGDVMKHLKPEDVSRRIEIVARSSVDVLDRRLMDCGEGQDRDPDKCSRMVTFRVVTVSRAGA